MKTWTILRDKNAPKKIPWTPVEEYWLQRAIRNADFPISWNDLYQKNQHRFHPLRRPFDLWNKWTYMNKHTQDRIFPEMPREKRRVVQHDVKRARRKIEEMPLSQVWVCTNISCQKKYAVHSYLSIVEHKAQCQVES